MSPSNGGEEQPDVADGDQTSEETETAEQANWSWPERSNPTAAEPSNFSIYPA